MAYHSLPLSLNLFTNALLKQMSSESDYDISVTNKPLMIDWSGAQLDRYFTGSDYSTIAIFITFVLYFMQTYVSEFISFLTPVTLFFNCITYLNQIIHNNYCQLIDESIKTSCLNHGYNERNICCLPNCQTNSTSYEQFYDKPVHGIIVDDFYPDCYQQINPFKLINVYFVRFIVYGILYMAIIIIIETKPYKTLFKFLQRIITKKVNNRNSDELQEVNEVNDNTNVRQEYETVSQLIASENYDSVSLIVDKLTKMFSKSLTIPNKLSFVVNKEECFGLLGTNGSGKTTTFRLLTGDLDMDSGNAYLGSDADLLHNKRVFYSKIGYCPQNDALLDRLTGMQTLVFFGRLRGLERNALQTFIANITEKFELKSIIHKRLSTYSGGNRRKLSLAVALIGTPRLLLLDEPTNGVDPDSRLKIWSLLRDLMSNSKVSILLTSHNMSECEALCSRLAIVSNGVIKTIGYVSQLKSSYAKGFDIILKVRNDANDEIIEALKARISEIFGDKCLIKYDNFGVIYYNLIRRDIKLSQIFHSLQELKNEFPLEDYFVANASLEQAFLSMVAMDETSRRVGYDILHNTSDANDTNE
ncbi:unnamed protein product [Oppiella nova]|uniref:ABC transporter domain-containing protein n=1 Tax=Oppiella nova TaxID=334625 RepID=A0A7R9LFP2_9ACAR|nr:unnamed protein product [Oppiella nova]CAG2162425.1 unnamed protein product [Oppiella nova]